MEDFKPNTQTNTELRAPVAASSTPVTQPTPAQPTLAVAAPRKHRSALKFLLALLIVLLLVGAVGGVYEWQQSKIKTLNTKITNLNSQIKTLKLNVAADNSIGGSQSSAPVSLDAELTYGDQTTGALTIDNGSVSIGSAFYATSFGDQGYEGFSDEGALVQMTITNNTASSETYSLDDFSFQLPNGQQIAFGETLGNKASDVTIAASGTSVEQLQFDSIKPADATAGTGYLIYKSPANGSSAKASLTLKKPYN